jgi:hypothetical protein
MPQKEMGQHTRQHVMGPAWVLADVIVVHAACGLRFLKALFDRPAYPPKSDHQPPGGTDGSVAQVVPVLRMRPTWPLDEPPHHRRGLPILAQPDPFAREFIRHRAFGPFGHRASIPQRRRERAGQRGHGARRGVGHRDPLGGLLPFLGLRGGVGASGWSPPRVSAGVATHATGPTPASQAAHKSGRLPYQQSAAIYLHGNIPAWWIAWTSAAAHWGVCCHPISSGTWHCVRRPL